MTLDPQQTGVRIAELFLAHAPGLFSEIVRSQPWRTAAVRDLEHAEREWEAFALYACVRGVVAGAGFNRETADALDAMHQAVLDAWARARGAGGTEENRRRIAQRHAEYGAIGQAGGKAGASTVTARLGVAAARHITGGGTAPELAGLIGELHETLAESVAGAVREDS